DLFDYSYTGLNFYVISNDIVITEVMRHSPAEEAGFQPDDVIMAVNGNFSRNIQVYKSMLQNAGDKVKLLVLRKGQPVLLTLHVKSIF
ncbi:MAG TPA: PDZ domain-containing protein, partial [Chitinophagaceae bacterium]|nr:PDZ domain-containing protein [Chitinophagaceae bacterium]